LGGGEGEEEKGEGGKEQTAGNGRLGWERTKLVAPFVFPQERTRGGEGRGKGKSPGAHARYSTFQERGLSSTLIDRFHPEGKLGKGGKRGEERGKTVADPVLPKPEPNVGRGEVRRPFRISCGTEKEKGKERKREVGEAYARAKFNLVHLGGRKGKKPAGMSRWKSLKFSLPFVEKKKRKKKGKGVRRGACL